MSATTGGPTPAETAPESVPGLVYPAASVLALALLCLPDLRVPHSRVELQALGVLLGLVLGVGMLHGLLFEVLLRIGARRPTVATFLWSALSLGVAWQLASTLGGFRRLGGRYHGLALAVLVASGAFALVLAGVLAAVQPRPSAPRGWLGAAPRGRRGWLIAGLLAGAAGLSLADRTFYAGQYLQGHLALRMAALWLAMCALYAGQAWLHLPRLTVGWAATSAAAFICGALLRPGAAAQHLLGQPWTRTLLGAGRALLDVDRDGYAALFAGGDCAEFDARVHPGAREIPGNGVDDNCAYGDARRAPERPEAATMPERPPEVDVVLVTVDSLRADHLQLDGVPHRLGRDTTPNLRRWARGAVVFRNAYSPGAWTSVALSSLMRGVYPRRLSFALFYETNRQRLLRSPAHKRLAPGEAIIKAFPLPAEDGHPTLAGWLRHRGMFTQAVVDDGYSQVLERNTGIGQGFEAYIKVDALPPARRDDRGAVDLAIRRLDSVASGRRFFLWLHLFGPHSPSERHPGVARYGPREVDGYDHEIRFLDQELGRFLEAVGKRKSPTMVILTSDHGEVFQGESRMHGFKMSKQDIHVPLLVRTPGWGPRVIDQPVTTLDVMPTVLAITGTPIPAGLDGVDLARWGAQRQPTEARVLLSDTWQYAPDGSCFNEKIAAYDGQRMLVLDRKTHTHRSYDMGDGRWVPDPRAADAAGPLREALGRYVEETGGALDLSD